MNNAYKHALECGVGYWQRRGERFRWGWQRDIINRAELGFRPCRLIYYGAGLPYGSVLGPAVFFIFIFCDFYFHDSPPTPC